MQLQKPSYRNKSLLFPLLALMLLLNSSLSFATTDPEVKPDTLLKSTTYNLIEALNKAQPEIHKNPNIIQDIVEQYVAPQLDFIAASRWVLGKYWRDIDRSQKIRFIKEFRKLLIQFYSTALAEYALTHEIDQKILRFIPLADNDSGDDVTIHSLVYPPNSSKTVPVNYHMHRTTKGWKIYDVSVEGISMITTYKNSFAPQLQSLGAEGLINGLAERNAQLASKKASLITPK